jgi:hypothetical protein
MEWTDAVDELVAKPGVRDEYEYSQHKLTFRGRRRKIIDPNPTVSRFTDWIYDLVHDDVPSWVRAESLEMGAEGEAEIERWRKIMPRPNVPSGWTLEFADPLDGTTTAFRISSLTLKGQPLYGRPDLVFRNSDGDIAIVERKVTRAKVPPQGWPNLKAQLWCYSWIDRWKDAREIYLIGEIWEWIRGTTCAMSPIDYPRWKRSDNKFHQECAELFRIYGGQFKG